MSEIPAKQMAARRRAMLQDVHTVRECLDRIEQEHERAQSDRDHMSWDRNRYRRQLEGAEARLQRIRDKLGETTSAPGTYPPTDPFRAFVAAAVEGLPVKP